VNIIEKKIKKLINGGRGNREVGRRERERGGSGVE
jgi:hypothetical protein